MIKEKKICWLLKINNIQNVRFCQKYNNTNELNLEDNKKVIDRLYKEDTKEICWIGDEAISYPNFIELVKYSKERSIRNKILFNNISNCKIEEIMKIVKYVDYITVTLDSIEEDVNEKLGKGKEYYKEICKYLKLLQDQVQINILTMINSQNAIEQKKIEEELFKFRIDSWIILGFMPILLDREADVEDLKVSKINCKFYYTLPWLLFNRLKHFYTLTEYTIARKYSIILPNGDIAVMNESESFVIGNILKETKERIEKNYNNKRRYLISKQSEQKIRIFIANSNEEIINEIINELTTLKYVEIIGTSNTGKETIEKILELKPEIAFLQYDFKDILGYNIMLELIQKLKLESPVFHLFSDIIPDDELHDLIRKDFCKINAWISNNRYKEQIVDIIESYKKYRDKD